jgi:hypothetical protein
MTTQELFEKTAPTLYNEEHLWIDDEVPGEYISLQGNQSGYSMYEAIDDNIEEAKALLQALFTLYPTVWYGSIIYNR